MDIAVTIFTIVLVAIFVVIIIIAFFKEKKSLSKYTTNLIFKNYNKKLDKISKLFNNERLDNILNSCRCEVVQKEKLNEDMLMENIKTIDKLEDNWGLLKKIQSEFAHRGMVEDKISLLKKNIEIVDMKDFVAEPVDIKHKALMFFNEKFNEVKLSDGVKTILSGTPCYKFGDVFMFLGKRVLKIDLENVFAVEILDYSFFDIKVWKKNEEWIDFDGTYDIEETEHKFPENTDRDDPYVKEQVLQKNYVLSLTNGSMVYDVEHKEVNKELQKKYDKLTKTFQRRSSKVKEKDTAETKTKEENWQNKSES